MPMHLLQLLLLQSLMQVLSDCTAGPEPWLTLYAPACVSLNCNLFPGPSPLFSRPRLPTHLLHTPPGYLKTTRSHPSRKPGTSYVVLLHLPLLRLVLPSPLTLLLFNILLPELSACPCSPLQLLLLFLLLSSSPCSSHFPLSGA